MPLDETSSVIISTSYKIPTWSGTTNELKALCIRLERILQKARENEIKLANRKSEKPITEEILNTYSETKEVEGSLTHKWAVQDLQRNLSTFDLRIKAVTKDGKSFTGPLESVLEYTDLTKLKSLCISAGASFIPSRTSLQIIFWRTYPNDVEIHSSHRDWLLYASSEIEEIISNNKPWYNVFKAHPMASQIVATLVAVSIVMGMALSEVSKLSIFALNTASLILLSAFAIFSSYVLPNFELRLSEDALRANQIKRLGFAVLSITTGVTIPLILPF